MIKGRPTWMGAGTEAVLAWVHAPEDGSSRGIVLIGSPLGREEVLGSLAVRRLAVLVARAGWTAVRFTWRGTGDAQPLSPHEDPVEAWQQDALTVLTRTRELLELPDAPAHAIGYRFGGAVLATLGDRVQARVAWEPVSGAALVRQWSRLRRTVAGFVPERAGEVDLLGLVLTDQQARSVARLPDPSESATAVVREKDRRRARAMYSVEPFDVRLHDDVLAQVVAALPAAEPRPARTDWEPTLENRWTTPEGVVLRERLVAVGPEPRTGIVTWREDTAAPAAPGTARDADDAGLLARDLRWSAPGAVVSGGGPDGRAGNGEWPVTARGLAADGVVVLRCDRPLVGDDAPEDELRAVNSYTLRSTIGLQDMVDWLRGRGCSPVHGAMHCASAWAACLGELHGRPLGTDSLVMLGHSEWKMDQDLWARVRETYDADARPAQGASGGPALRGAREPSPSRIRPAADAPPPTGSRRAIMEAARSRDLGALRHEARAGAVRWARTGMPYAMWRRLGRAGVIVTPEVMLEPLASRQPVTIVNGPDDTPRWEQTRADRAVRRLAARGLPIRDVRDPHMDHSLLTAEARRGLLQALRQGFGLEPSTARSAEAADASMTADASMAADDDRQAQVRPA